MIAETKKLGLKFNAETIDAIVLGKSKSGRHVPPDVGAEKNESMTRGWSLLEYIPRKKPLYGNTSRPTFAGLYLPRSEQRLIPEGAMIHQSVFDRSNQHSCQLPANLPADHSVCS